MFRLIALPLLALLAAPLAARAQVPLLHPSPQFNVVGPGMARGVLVWLGRADDPARNRVPPAAQPWVGRMAARGYDIWRLDRISGHDQPKRSAAALLQGVKTLRRRGYRRVVVAGHARGGFIALWALSRPKLVDAVAALAPAAPGADRTRRAAFAARIKAIPRQHRHPARFALVTRRGAAAAPGAGRLPSLARRAARHTGLKLLTISRPDARRGEAGDVQAAFDARFGGCLAAFLDGRGKAGHCPGG